MRKGILEIGEKPSEADLEKNLPQLPPNLPKSYINFLRNHNGASGDFPVEIGWFQLWQIGELVQANQDYEVQIYLPNYFGIGSNGGGELIAINLKNQKVFATPFIGMDEKDAWLIAENFTEFEKKIGFAKED